MKKRLFGTIPMCEVVIFPKRQFITSLLEFRFKERNTLHEDSVLQLAPVLPNAFATDFLTNQALADSAANRLSLAISGGASKGAYEAGLTWGIVAIIRQVREMPYGAIGGDLRPVDRSRLYLQSITFQSHALVEHQDNQPFQLFQTIFPLHQSQIL